MRPPGHFTPRRPELRRKDFTLTDDQEILRETFRAFFQQSCPLDLVRREEVAADGESLWSDLNRVGLFTAGISLRRGGDGATLNDLALLAEESGRVLLPVPWVESVVGLRSLDRVMEDPGPTEVAGLSRLTIAINGAVSGCPMLVPGLAIAKQLIALVDGSLVLVRMDERTRRVANLGGEPIGWWRPRIPQRGDLLLADGKTALQEFRHLRTEWQLLTAATLVGMAQAVLTMGIDYAKERCAFGVPIGTFQAISHPLVDVATAVEGARHLVWKACWIFDHEPQALGALAQMAFLHAQRTASGAARTTIHVLGGLGFTLESNAQLYLRKVKSTALVAGDPEAGLLAIADDLYGTNSKAS